MSKANIRARFREYADNFDDSVTDEELDEFLDEFADMVAAHENRLRYIEKTAKDATSNARQQSAALASALVGVLEKGGLTFGP